MKNYQIKRKLPLVLLVFFQLFFTISVKPAAICGELANGNNNSKCYVTIETAYNSSNQPIGMLFKIEPHESNTTAVFANDQAVQLRYWGTGAGGGDTNVYTLRPKTNNVTEMILPFDAVGGRDYTNGAGQPYKVEIENANFSAGTAIGITYRFFARFRLVVDGGEQNEVNFGTASNLLSFTIGDVCSPVSPSPSLTIGEESPETITEINGTTTFTFSGAYLTGDIAIASSNPDFTVLPATVPAADGNIANTIVTVTYVGTATETSTTVTLSGGGAESKTVEVQAQISGDEDPNPNQGTAMCDRLIWLGMGASDFTSDDPNPNTTVDKQALLSIETVIESGVPVALKIAVKPVAGHTQMGFASKPQLRDLRLNDTDGGTQNTRHIEGEPSYTDNNVTPPTVVYPAQELYYKFTSYPEFFRNTTIGAEYSFKPSSMKFSNDGNNSHEFEVDPKEYYTLRLGDACSMVPITPPELEIEDTPDNITDCNGTTFTFSGAYLTGDITIASSNSDFTVSPAVVSPEDRSITSAVVTVTYTGGDASASATITLTGTGVEETVSVQAAGVILTPPSWGGNVSVEGTPQAKSVVLDVSAVEKGCFDIDYFNVYAVSGDVYTPLVGDYEMDAEGLITVTGLVANTDYVLVVKAVDIHGNESDYSNEVSLTTEDAEIGCMDSGTLNNGNIQTFKYKILNYPQPDGGYTVEITFFDVLRQDGTPSYFNYIRIMSSGTSALNDKNSEHAPFTFIITENSAKGIIPDVPAGTHTITYLVFEERGNGYSGNDNPNITFSTDDCALFNVSEVPAQKLGTDTVVIKGANLSTVKEITIGGVPVTIKSRNDSIIVVNYTPPSVGIYEVTCSRITSTENWVQTLNLIVHNDPEPLILKVDTMSVGEYYFHIEGRNISGGRVMVNGRLCESEDMGEGIIRVMYQANEPTVGEGLTVVVSTPEGNAEGRLVIVDNPDVFVFEYDQYTLINENLNIMLADRLEDMSRMDEKNTLLSGSDWYLEDVVAAGFIPELDEDPLSYARENYTRFPHGDKGVGAGIYPWINSHIPTVNRPSIYHCRVGEKEYTVIVKINPVEITGIDNPQYLAHVTYDLDGTSSASKHVSLGNYTQISNCEEGTAWPGDGHFMIANNIATDARRNCIGDQLPNALQWIGGLYIDHTQNKDVENYRNLVGNTINTGQGNMFIINANDKEDGLFLTQYVYIPCSEGKMLFQFHAMNLDGTGTDRISPNVKASIYYLRPEAVSNYLDAGWEWKNGLSVKNVLSEHKILLDSLYTGDVPANRTWNAFTHIVDFTSLDSDIAGGLHLFLELSNVNVGGGGNDFALDDVIMARIPAAVDFKSPCVCDDLEITSVESDGIIFENNPAIELNPQTSSSTMTAGSFRWLFSKTGEQGTWVELQDNLFQADTVVNLQLDENVEIAGANYLFGHFKSNAGYPEFENEDDPTPNLYIKLNADGSIPEALKGFYKIELSGSGSFESSCVDVGVFDVISVIPEIIGTPPETVCGGEKIEVSINAAENKGYIWEKIVGDKSYFYAEGEKIVIQPAPEDEERTETFRVTTIQTHVEQENCRGGFANISVIVKRTPSMKLE